MPQDYVSIVDEFFNIERVPCLTSKILWRRASVASRSVYNRGLPTQVPHFPLGHLRKVVYEDFGGATEHLISAKRVPHIKSKNAPTIACQPCCCNNTSPTCFPQLISRASGTKHFHTAMMSLTYTSYAIVMKSRGG